MTSAATENILTVTVDHTDSNLVPIIGVTGKFAGFPRRNSKDLKMLHPRPSFVGETAVVVMVVIVSMVLVAAVESVLVTGATIMVRAVRGGGKAL